MATNVKLKLRTKELTQSIRDTASRRMYQAVEVVKVAQLETLSGDRSGRTYKVPGTNRTYTASRPGQPPAQATGGLRQSLQTSVSGKGRTITGKSGTKLPYGKMLDDGTLKIAPRPWLMPSLLRALPKLREIFKRSWL